MPVVIAQNSGVCQSVPIPNILRINTKYKTPMRKNDMFDHIITSMEQNTTSQITIGQSVIPMVISTPSKLKKQQKRFRKISKNNSPRENGIAKVSQPVKNKSELALLNDLDESNVEHNNSHFLPNESVATILDETLEINEAGPVPHFYSLRTKVITVMEPTCKYSFHGKLKIKVLAGAVRIYGAKLDKFNTQVPVEVYSSRGTNLVCIEAIESVVQTIDDVASVWDALEDDNIDRNISNDLQTDINNIKIGSAVLIIQNLENNLTKFLGIYSMHRLFPKIENSTNYSWSDYKRAEIVLQANIYYDNSRRQTIEFNYMNEVTQLILNDKTVKNSRIILAGGKNVGKSTAMRNLVNRMLEKTEAVIVLDLDPGQAEFTPPACISMNIVTKPLLGPNFSHLMTPYHQLYIGGIDVIRCMKDYILGVKKLVQQVNEYCGEKSMPIIVNTMGFCKGVGWDIMCYVIKSVQPTDIIQIMSKRSKNNFDQPLNHQIVSSQVIKKKLIFLNKKKKNK